MSQPSPLTGARQQAQALAGSGDLEGARGVLENAVAMGRFHLGKDHPDVLATALQLAQLLLAAEDPSAARRVLEVAYADGHWRLGDTDPVMVLISYDLGVAAEELGNRHEARKAYSRVAEFGTGVLGRDHWAVARAHDYLGEPPEPGTVRIELPPPPPPAAPPLPPPPSFTPEPALTDPRPATTPREPTHRDSQPPLPPILPAYQQTPAPAPTYQQTTAPAPTYHQTAAQAPAFHQAQSQQPTYRQTPGQDLAIHQTGGQELTYRQAPSQELAFHQAPVQQPSTPLDPPWEVGRGSPTEPVGHGYELQRQLSAPPAAIVVRQDPERSAYARKAPALFAVIAAVLASVIAVVALVVVLAMRGGKPDNPNVPTLGGGPAPSDVVVAPSGSSIKVSWTDPANGTTTFVVSGGHPGEVLRPMGQVSLGVTSLTLNGLNPDLDYCFTVVAVYSSNEFATSPQVCTRGTTGRPRPSTT